jgi:Cu+-exporting ATPase
MHPEVVSYKPGVCPKCGMALEPRISAAHTYAESPHIRDLRRRFFVSSACTVLVAALSLTEMIPALRGWIPSRLTALFEAILTAPVVLWGAIPFYRSAWAGAKAHSTNMYTLITLGISAAFLFSVAVVIAPNTFAPSATGSLSVYFDTAAIITTLILLGDWLQLLARGKTSEAIRKLAGLQAKTAHVIRDGKEVELPLSEIQPDDLLRVKPGEKIPTDGEVVEGTALADEAMITGESAPVRKNAGDTVIGATIISGGSLLVKATRLGGDTVLAQIIQLVRTAQSSRAPVQKLADKIAAIFVPTVVGIAVITFFAWLIFGPPPGSLHGLVNAVAVLIIACPCALGLATPMAVTAAVGRGAQHGILIKNGQALELASSVTAVVVDKTGTLTLGKPKLVAIETADVLSENGVLSLAAAVESYSEHPLADAVVRAARDRQLNIPPAADFETVTGHGVRAKVDGAEILAGNAGFFAERGISTDLQRGNGQSALQAATQILVAKNSQLIGALYVADPIRPAAREAVKGLRAMNIEIVMASGDRDATARAIATELGIVNVHSQVLPEEKVNIVKELQSKGRRVLFAGDGINDAPALAQADVGVAMASGTDIAMESADIALLHGDLSRLLGLIRLSRQSHAIIRENLLWAFLYNTLGVPIAAGLFYPFFGLLLSPVIASAAMSFSSLSVVMNSLRLRRTTL